MKKEPNEQNIHQFIRTLIDYRETCEKEGKCDLAEGAVYRIYELKSKDYNRRYENAFNSYHYSHESEEVDMRQIVEDRYV